VEAELNGVSVIDKRLWGCRLGESRDGLKLVVAWSIILALCYIWEQETAEEKKEAEKWLNRVNAFLEPGCKAK
jgi:hypothetical protein